jgi:Domain of unknown function (DUF4124)
MKRPFVLAIMIAICAPAYAQTLYRCQAGAEVTYSDRPCVTGSQSRVSAGAKPPDEVIASSRAQLDQQIQMWALKEAMKRQRERSVSQPTASQRAPLAGAQIPDSSSNSQALACTPAQSIPQRTAGK